MTQTTRPAESTQVRCTASSKLLVPVLLAITTSAALVSGLGAPLIPDIAHDQHVSLAAGQWVLTTTLAAAAMSTPVVGFLADGPRKKHVVVGGVLAVSLGCVLAAIAPAFWLLLVGRLLQGVGLGLVPGTISIARATFADDRAPRTIAAIAVAAATSVGLGYPATALLADHSSYRVAYGIAAAVLALIGIAALFVLPSFGAPTRRFDVIGSALLVVWLGCGIVALSQGGAWGWRDPRIVTLGAGASLVLGAWIWHQLHCRIPLVQMRLLRRRAVALADLATFLSGFASLTFMPMLVQWVQIPKSSGYGFGASLLSAGLVMTPLSVTTVIATKLAGGRGRALKPRPMLITGALIQGAATTYFCLAHGSLADAYAASALVGLGYGCIFAALPVALVGAVSVSETGGALGFHQLLRTIGMTAGTALGTAILSAHTPHGMRVPLESGFRDVLLVSVGASLAVALVGGWLPTHGAPGRAGIQEAM